MADYRLEDDYSDNSYGGLGWKEKALYGSRPAPLQPPIQIFTEVPGLMKENQEITRELTLLQVNWVGSHKEGYGWSNATYFIGLPYPLLLPPTICSFFLWTRPTHPSCSKVHLSSHWFIDFWSLMSKQASEWKCTIRTDRVWLPRGSRLYPTKRKEFPHWEKEVAILSIESELAQLTKCQ